MWIYFFLHNQRNTNICMAFKECLGLTHHPLCTQALQSRPVMLYYDFVSSLLGKWMSWILDHVSYDSQPPASRFSIRFYSQKSLFLISKRVTSQKWSRKTAAGRCNWIKVFIFCTRLEAQHCHVFNLISTLGKKKKRADF